MQTTILKTWKPTTAGILNIIAGTINVFSAIGILIGIIAIGNTDITHFLSPADAPFIVPLIVPVLIVVLILTIICAVIPIVSGIFALQRERWGWALAGSIIAMLGVFPLGVASTVFIAMSKDEFL